MLVVVAGAAVTAAPRLEYGSGQGVERSLPGDLLEFSFRTSRTLWSDERRQAFGTLTVRRVTGQARFTFEAKVVISGEVSGARGTVRWGPRTRTMLFAYADDVALDQVLAGLEGPGAVEHHPAGVCRMGGVSVECEETTEPDLRWRRLVARDAPELALSGGLLLTHKGDLDDGPRSWQYELIRVARGPADAAEGKVLRVPGGNFTPLVHAMAAVHLEESAGSSHARSDGERAREQLEEALRGCERIEHDFRARQQEVIATLLEGRLTALGPTRAEDVRPPASTLECLRGAAAKLALPAGVASVPLTWRFEGGETDWEKTIKNVNSNVLTAWTVMCLDEHRLLDEHARPRPVVARATADGAQSLTLDGRPAPKAVLDCLKSHGVMMESPLPAATTVELSLGLRGAPADQR